MRILPFRIAAASSLLCRVLIPLSQVASWICSLLRLYARCVTLRCPGWDDFFVVLTMVCCDSRNPVCSGSSVCVCVCVMCLSD